MVILLLIGLAQAYDFATATINVTTVSSGTLKHAPGYDACKKIVVRPTQIFHLSNNSLYESWDPSDLSDTVEDKTVSPYGVFDMGIGPDARSVAFSLGNLNLKYYTLESDHEIDSQQSEYFPGLISQIADYVFSDSDYIYAYYKQGNLITGNAVLQKISKDTQTLVDSINFDSPLPHITVTPNYIKFLVWNDLLNVSMYDLSSFTYIDSWSPNTTAIYGSTQKITFSADSSLALIEADYYYPIIVLNLTSMTMVTFVNVTDVVKEAHFLDNTNMLIIVKFQSSLTLIDLNTKQQYSLPALPATVIDADHLGHLYTCHNNIVTQTYYTFTRIGAAPNTTNSTNTTSPTNTTQIGYETTEQAADASFYTTFKMTQAELAAYQAIRGTLEVTNEATSVMTTVATSFPLTVYFLSFLNYFSLASLYVLLNFPIPQQVYTFLSLIYAHVNANILNFLGLVVSLPPLCQQIVDNPRALFFEVSSDIIPDNINNFNIFFANIFLLVIIQVLFSRLTKNNIMKAFIQKEKQNMVYGQITNLMISLTLPWSFMLVKSGVTSMKSKLNMVLFITLFFVCAVFPIYYLFELIYQEKRNKSTKRLQKSKNCTHKTDIRKRVINWNAGEKRGRKKQPKSMLKKTQFAENIDPSSVHASTNFPVSLKKAKVKQTFKILKIEFVEETTKNIQRQKPLRFFGDLLTWEVAEAWYLCESNFLVPALVLLNNPIFFFVPVFLFYFLGLLIATKRRKWRLNAIFLASYSLIIHGCFCIFYWSTSLPVLLYTQLLCLAVFLMGAVHHCILFIIQILVFIYLAIGKFRKTNQVYPNDQKNTKTPKNLKKAIETQRTDFSQNQNKILKLQKAKSTSNNRKLIINNKIAAQNQQQKLKSYSELARKEKLSKAKHAQMVSRIEKESSHSEQISKIKNKMKQFNDALKIQFTIKQVDD